MYILVYTLSVRDLSITEFRRQCLSLLEDLPEEGIVITKHGQPVARVAPVRPVRKGKRVTLPLLKGKGRPGPLCPNTETPYDLVFD
jgi:prevent-host-death family protein